MSGKHDHQCACVECIAYMETNLQVDLDEWLADDVVFPGMVPSNYLSVGTATNNLTADTTENSCSSYRHAHLIPLLPGDKLDDNHYMVLYDAMVRYFEIDKDSEVICPGDSRYDVFIRIHNFEPYAEHALKEFIALMDVVCEPEDPSQAVNATKELQCHVGQRMPNQEDMLRITLSSPYIGRRIRKKLCRKWSTGIITAWDAVDKLYHVRYDEDDSEDLDHNEMHECLMCFEKHWSQQQLTKHRRNEMQGERLRKNAQVP